jgi:hypothetical protein
MKDKTSQKMLGKNGFKYRQQYGVIVICKDEKNQESVFEDLKKQGHKCKVVTV